MHGHRGLVVFGRRENLRCLGRHRGIFLDQTGHHTTQGLNTQGKRRHVKQQHVFDVTRQNPTLNRCACGDRFIGVNVFAWLASEKFSHCFLNLGHTGLTANQDHLVDIADLQTCVIQRRAARSNGTGYQVFHQGFQLRPGQLDIEMLRTIGIRRDVRQVYFGLLTGRQFDLRAFGGFFEALKGERVVAQVETLVFLELLNQVIDDALVEILATEKGIAVGGQHFELVLTVHVSDLDDGNVKGSATQVIDGQLAITTLFVHAVRQCRGGGLIDDSLDRQAGNFTGVLGGLSLRVIEIGRYRDDSLGDFFTQVVFSGFLHFHQHPR